MNVRTEEIVPIIVTGALVSGQILEFDSANHEYVPLDTGVAAGILLEAVDLNQDTAMALVGFAGEYEDGEVTFSDDADTELDQLAELRDAGIFVIERSDA